MTHHEWNPGELLELSGYFWKTCTLHAAVKLDVFTCLGEEQLSGKEVSDRLKASSKGVERLLNALVAMELLTKADDKYVNTSSAREFLSKDSPKYLGNIIMHHHHLVESWSRLDQGVQKAAAALEPGGILIIHEFILDNSMDGPLFPALFSLNMLLGTDSGQAYSEQQLMDMLADAGAQDIHRLAVQTPNDSGIITGIV